MAPCDDVAIPWLQQNKAKLGSSKDEVRRCTLIHRLPVSPVPHREVQSPKDEKVFAKRGSILGSLTASISEALSSASSQQSAAAPPPPASDVSDSIFSALKRKGSSFSDAIFNSSDGGGHCSFRASSLTASLNILPQVVALQIRPCLHGGCRIFWALRRGQMMGASTSWCKLYWMIWDRRQARPHIEARFLTQSQDILPRFKEHDYSDDVIGTRARCFCIRHQ
jgi:hypothetical protein